MTLRIARGPVTKLLLALGVTLGIIWAGGFALLLHNLTTVDPYPAFMPDYARGETGFDQFVARTFPVGSNAQDAIAKIRLWGLRGGGSKAGSYQFFWIRHAGFCGEDYSIILRENSDGTIAEISGWKQTRCL